MDIEFEKLNIPNFIRTKQGTFQINKLSKEEIERYIDVWKFAILQRWEQKDE
jgi:hypothetical protein